MNPALHTDTVLARAVRAIFRRLEKEIALDVSVDVYLAGGIAVHLYTGTRVTTDIDAEFSHRIIVPPDLAVDVVLENGVRKLVYLDSNYNSTLGMMHPDYLKDAIPVDLGLDKLTVRVLSPVDLAVSKIARLANNDKEDIAELVRAGLTTADAIEQRTHEAEDFFVGNPGFLKFNIYDAINIARAAEADKSRE
jgi:hypothetical protein